MKAVSNNKTEPTVIKVKNTGLVLKNKHQLSTIIVDSRGRPDTLAINLYWDEFRSWHNPKKIYNKGNVVYSSRLKKKGISTSYQRLSKKYGFTKETLRQKVVKLEELELISRDFETETKFKKVFHNQLVIHVWQQTPHFYNPMGVDREQIKELRLSTNHEYIESKYNKSSILSNNDNKTPCNTTDRLSCKGGKGIQVQLDRGYPSKIGSQDSSQAQLDKGVKADSGIQKNEDTNIKLQNSSQSQLDKGVQDKGGIIIRDDRGIIVDEDTYILREELESLTESSLRSSFKNTPVIEVSNTEPPKTKKITETNHATFSNAILAEHSQVAITKTDKQTTDGDQSNQPLTPLTALEENYSYLQKKQQDPNERSEDGVGVLMTKIASSQEQVVDSKMEIATNPLEQNIEPLESSREPLYRDSLSHHRTSDVAYGGFAVMFTKS